MINYLLKLKNWQVFSITFIPIITVILLHNQDLGLLPENYQLAIFYLIDLLLGIYTLSLCSLILFFWLMVIHFNNALPINLKLNLKLFHFCYAFTILAPFVLITFGLYLKNHDLPPVNTINLFFVPGTLILLLSIHFIPYTIAKIIRTHELKRNTSFKDFYWIYSMVNCYLFFGVWFIQPRINRIAEQITKGKLTT